MVAGVHVRADGDADAQQEQVGVVPDRQLAQEAAAPVPAAVEEGLVRFREGRAPPQLFFRQRVDAGGSYMCYVDVQLEAAVHHVQHP